MSSQFEPTGWITTKSSTPSTNKPEAALRKLHQTSLQDFLRRKPLLKDKQCQKDDKKPRKEGEQTQKRTTQSQKENRQVTTPMHSKKRKKEEERSVARKKHKKETDSPNHGPVGGQPSRWTKGLGDPSSPYIVPDSQGVVSWDDTTVWDSATTSRSIRVNPLSAASSPSEGRTISKRGDAGNFEGVLKHLKVPVSPPTKQRSEGHVLALDASPRRHISPGDPFIASPPHCASTEFHDTVIPSSQPHEIEFDTSRDEADFLVPSSQTLDPRFSPPSLSQYCSSPRRARTTSNESIIPSSQSQYLLSYKASPPRPSPHYFGEDHCALDRTEVIPSSQSQEVELQIPFPSRNEGIPSMEKGSIADPLSNSVSCDWTSGLTSPSRSRRGTPRVTIQSLDESSLPSGSPSPIHIPMEHESQYTFIEESFPPELTEFMALVDQDRDSLGSIFQAGSLGNSLEENGIGKERESEGPGPHARPRWRSFGSDSPQQHVQSVESLSPVRIPVGQESQYTFVDESHPPEVSELLDNIDQDRGSLGSEFQESILSGSI